MNLRDTLTLHKRWLETGRVDGRRADFGAEPERRFYTEDHRVVTLEHHSPIPLAALFNANSATFPEGCDLREARFDGADLTDFRLANCILAGASFIGANLTRARFDRANLSRSNLSNVKGLGASFEGANLSQADLTSAQLPQANLAASILNRTVLIDADLSEANLHGVRAADALMERVVLTGSDLSAGDFTEANMAYAHLVHARLSDVTLDDADLFRTDLSNVTGKRLSARRTRLTLARLSGCTLIDSDFDEALLQGVVLEAADLSNSCLDRTDIRAHLWEELVQNGSELVRQVHHTAPSVTGVVLNGCRFYGAWINVALLQWLPASVVRSAIRVEGGPMNPIRVFIAHATEDLDAALQIYAGLVREGFAPWIDKRDLKVGEEWQRVIPSIIQKSDAVIVCLSRKAIEKRGYIQNEFRLALETLRQGPFGWVFVVPIRLEECDVPPEFERFHWVDYWEHDCLAHIVHSLKDLHSK